MSVTRKVLEVFRAEMKRAQLSKETPVGEGTFASGYLAVIPPLPSQLWRSQEAVTA
jgi:hypothetical protein